jgi:hypothetical protein
VVSTVSARGGEGEKPWTARLRLSETYKRIQKAFEGRSGVTQQARLSAFPGTALAKTRNDSGDGICRGRHIRRDRQVARARTYDLLRGMLKRQL